jgi:hypothetical protein
MSNINFYPHKLLSPQNNCYLHMYMLFYKFFLSPSCPLLRLAQWSELDLKNDLNAEKNEHFFGPKKCWFCCLMYNFRHFFLMKHTYPQFLFENFAKSPPYPPLIPLLSPTKRCTFCMKICSFDNFFLSPSYPPLIPKKLAKKPFKESQGFKAIRKCKTT